VKSILYALVGVSVAAIATHAQAQTTTPDTSSDEIIVTAQLRQQRPVDVPVAVSVLTGNQLDRLGLDELEEAARFIPGLLVQNQSPNNPGFVVRGITSDSGTAYNEPRVSVFQDGVSISKSRGSYVELFDMERLEVAKGPQSTLYGRGALIGAVNLVQNKADLTGFSAFGSGSYGNFNAWTAEGMVNVPLSNDVALRVAGRVRKSDGYVDNLLGGAAFNSDNTRAVRASLRVGTGPLTFDLIGNYQKDDPTGTSFKSISYLPTDPITGATIGDTGRNSGAALVPAAGFENGRPLGLDRQVWGVTGIANLDLGNHFKLTSITAYRRFDALEVFDADGLSLPIITAAEDAQGRQTSQELRLHYEHGRLTAFVGASYFHEDGSQRTPVQFDEREALARLAGALNGGGAIPGRAANNPAPAALFGNTAFTGQLLQGIAGAYGVALSAAQAQAIAANLQPGHLETSTNYGRTSAYDLFGDVTYKVSDTFELGGGLRWSHEDKTTSFSSAVLNGRSILGGFIGALGQPAATRDALLGALAVPGAATIPPSAAFPVPLFGLSFQPTAGNGQTDSQNMSDAGFAWRLTARYAPTPDTSIYATYSRGRRPEVLTASAPSTPFGTTRFATLPAETVDSYEVGAKGNFANHHLFIDGSVYLYHYENFQTTVQQGTLFVQANAGEARSYGFEGDLRWVPNSMLTLFATYSYNHSRFTTGAYNGNHFRLSPDNMASIGAEIDVPAGPGRVTITPSVTYQSTMFFDDNNDRPDLQTLASGALVADTIQDEVQGGFALANLRVGYEFKNGLQIEGFVDNLFDEKYIKDAGNTGDALGLPTFIAGEPRFYGVRVSFRFGAAK
jgi:outer membrane receptor protein involved in Fe transport